MLGVSEAFLPSSHVNNCLFLGERSRHDNESRKVNLVIEPPTQPTCVWVRLQGLMWTKSRIRDFLTQFITSGFFRIRIFCPGEKDSFPQKKERKKLAPVIFSLSPQNFLTISFSPTIYSHHPPIDTSLQTHPLYTILEKSTKSSLKNI